MLDTIEINLHNHTHEQNRFAVIPTAEKLKAKSEFTGEGVRIAFLDSGFFPHPDFAERVVAYADISGEEKTFHSITEPKARHWHGTQTVAVCAGDGLLSGGVYCGLAHRAELVLVKVSADGQISDASIEKGLRWVLENREKYNIRVLNMSLGGDMDAQSSESKINQLAEELIKQGVCITVAAGNSADSFSIPPANSPSVITVGGYSDENQFSERSFNLYHSNFGKTIDGFVKPEIIAPAMFIAAPILPETKDYLAAETLSILSNAPDYSFRIMLEEYWQNAGLSSDILNLETSAARKIIEYNLHKQQIVATHYKHVDGTSFAAPITASVVAQMLEANPNLTPAAVKNILISTASKLSQQPLVRQGFGVLNARLAVEEALRETHFLVEENYSPPRIEGEKIVFFYHDHTAKSVFLGGDFNDWDFSGNEFFECDDGVWRAEIPFQPSGKYAYKFFVNGERWTEDTSHGLKEEDGYGEYNSILIIE
ncbi:MAG TPA: S8 family serine peptidase [Pyrinomonadaceae bacterium]|jgi:serine protease AprX